MADVLLTHPYHLYYDRKQIRKMQPYPPLGTLYAAALLRQKGFSVALFDSMLNDPAEGFPEALRKQHPKVAVIYEDNFNFLSKMCLSRMREVAFEMIDAARMAGARVVVHGSDSSDHCAEYLARGADYVLEGEAEWTLLEVVGSLVRDSKLDPVSIPGVAYSPNGNGRVIRSARRPLMRDLDQLPFPARDLVDLGLYRQVWQEAHGFFSLNLVSSRGCPYRCNWCAKPIYGDSFHARTPETVAEEIRQLRERYGADHLWFADDLFGINSRWIQNFASHVRSRNAAVPFKIQARADLMRSEDTVAALALCGCAEVWMGVESGSQKILDAMDKGIRVEQVLKARANLRQHGIRACFFLQFGYPGETWNDIQKTIQMVRKARPDDIGVSVSYPLPGTKFYQRVRDELGAKSNWVDSDDLAMMFKGAYTSDFYRALRDALHAEVESWSSQEAWRFSLRDRSAPAACVGTGKITELWNRVEQLEPACRNSDATLLPVLACSAMGCD
ncbi:MAG: B12-binding domain-containing radical SAM protein [Acidobacteria bacterium]|nr:MAG: B12-binding domain-containing radical SAM protein [Acidobacteriota bacterium]